MANNSDISETQLLLAYGDEVCTNLLMDRTTQQNIYWATDSYAEKGKGYTLLEEFASMDDALKSTCIEGRFRQVDTAW